MGNGSVPVLFSNSTNWAPKPFIKLFDFLEQIEGKKPDFDKLTDEAMAKETKF